MQPFSNFLNSYTKAFNKKYDRKGSLFIDHLKRSEADKDRDVRFFAFYIHKNAVHHGYKNKIGEWLFDSYNSILSDRPTLLARDAIVDWFGGRREFVQFHEQPVFLKHKEFEEPA